MHMEVRIRRSVVIQVLSLIVASHSDNSAISWSSSRQDATSSLRYSKADELNARLLQYRNGYGLDEYSKTQSQAAAQYRQDDDHYIMPGKGPAYQASGAFMQTSTSTAMPLSREDRFPLLLPGHSSHFGSGSSGSGANSGSAGNSGSGSSSGSSLSSGNSSGSGWFWPWDWGNWPWEYPYWAWWQYGMTILFSCCLCCCTVTFLCHSHVRQVKGKHGGRNAGRNKGKKKRQKQRIEDEGYSDGSSDSSDEAFGDRSLLERVKNGSYHSQRTSNGTWHSPSATAFSAQSYLQPQQEHLRYVDPVYMSSVSPQPVKHIYT